jgi:hypothetical protein
MSDKQLDVEGTVKLTIAKVEIIKHRFKQDEAGAYEVKVKAGKRNAANEREWAEAYLQIDSDYLKPDQRTDTIETNADKTFSILAGFGVPSNGMELAKVDEAMRGIDIEFFGKRNEKGLRFYINTPRVDVVVDAADAAQQVASLYGAGGTTAAATRPGANQPGGIDPAVDAIDDGDEVPF